MLRQYKKEGVFLNRISQTYLDKGTNPYAGLSVVVQHWNSETGMVA
jgi:hypothetical protein